MRDNKTEKIILSAAEEEFLLKGFAGARTTEIAQRAGVNHAMLHYYFKTKEHLFDEVMADKINLFRSSVVSVFELSDMPVEELVVEAMSRHFDFLRANPMLPRFIINEVITRAEYMEKIKTVLLPIAGGVINKLQQKLDEAADRGEICKVDAFMLLMDIASLNLFVFVAHPIFASAQDMLGDIDAFYEQRKNENIELIVKRLTI